MDLGMHASEPPPFHKLGEYRFQDLCCNILENEPDIATCHVYGKRGEAQRGIDLLALRRDGDGIEVGQCKCYEKFSPADIRGVSEEFFKYWGYWSDQKIKRFILFVACDLSSTQQVDEITRQYERFKQHGIVYAAWSAVTIRNKLQLYPRRASLYLPDYWVEAICRAAISSPTGMAEVSRQVSASEAVLRNHMEQLALHLAEDTDERLVSMRTALREGRDDEAAGWVQKLRGDSAVWPILPAEVKAKILRFEASLELATGGDLEQVKRLADEARALSPADEYTRLQAWIACIDGDLDSALRLLEGREDTDSLNLQAAFLLNVKTDEARTVLEILISGARFNAETLRLLALAELASGNLPQAELNIRKALEMAPRWESIQFTAAAIDYFGALSPVARPHRLVPWPEPVSWALIKRDTESFVRLRQAAGVFKELAERPRRSPEMRRNYECWRLACLADDPARQEEAAMYVRQLLDSDPVHQGAILWAVRRLFAVDLGPSKMALEKLAAGDDLNVKGALALTICYFASDNGEQAVRLLERMRPKFEENDLATAWTFWYAQALAVAGDPEAALQVIESYGLAAELRDARTVALRALAKDTEGRGRLLQHLETCYNETGDSSYLYEACEVAARNEQWAYIADRAERLVGEIGTAEALHLAVAGTYNDRRYEVCRKLLSDNLNFFPGNSLPGNLLRLQVQCLSSLGVLPAAIAKAEKLVREEPTMENLAALAQLCFKHGDLKRLAVVARQLRNRSDLTSEQALWLSRWLRPEDRELAVMFWHRALEHGVPDMAVGLAITLGFHLGLDSLEIKPLLNRMATLAQDGVSGVEALSTHELVDWLKQYHEHMSLLEKVYRRSQAPVHLIVQESNQPLADLFHTFPTDNKRVRDPRKQIPLMFRHGGRVLPAGFPQEQSKRHFHLDISAILLAEHLEVLDKVEEAFQPLYISDNLVPALIAMRETVAHPQPRRVGIARQIIDFAERGLLQPVRPELPPGYDNNQLVEELGVGRVALFEATRASGGYLVDFIPLTKRDLSGPPSALPEDAGKVLSSCQLVIEALGNKGLLSESVYGRALELTSDPQETRDQGVVPQLNSPLYCHANIPEVLAEAGVLEAVCENYKVFVEESELEQLRAGLRAHDQRHLTEQWLTGLIERIRRGLEDDRYRIFVASPDLKTKLPGYEDAGPECRCFLDLMCVQDQEDAVAWVDDRCANGYARMGNMPVVGVNEMLKMLVGKGALSEGDYYVTLSRMRAANIRFIPVEAHEIVYWLGKARVEINAVIETPELAILRRHLNACWLQRDLLQLPSKSADVSERNEVFFVWSSHKAVADALVELWKFYGHDDANCLPRAEWLISSLYADLPGLLKTLALLTPEQDERYLAAIDLAGLIGCAFGMDATSTGQRPSLRQRYLEWLYYRLLIRRFDADPLLLIAVVERFKEIVAGVCGQLVQDKLPEQVIVQQFVIGRFHDDLPPPLRDELERDRDFLTLIGCQSIRVVTVDNFRFGQDEFFDAAHKAVNGSTAKLAPLEGKETDFQFTIQSFTNEKGRKIISLAHPHAQDPIRLNDPMLELLSESLAEREVILRRNRDWFDCSEDVFKRAVADIALTAEPKARVEKAQQWRRSSAAVYYAELGERLRNREPIGIGDLQPPNGEGLLEHYRLHPDVGAGDSFRNALNEASTALLRDEGLLATLEKLIGFPVPLPTVLTEAITELPQAERRTIIKGLLRRSGSPVARVHLVHILRAYDQVPAYGRLVRRITVSLMDKRGKEEFDAFAAFLNWVNSEFNRWPDSREWTSHLRLAMVWAHTHRLLTAFATSGLDLPKLKEYIGERKGWVLTEVFEREPESWSDVAHPRLVSWEGFLLAGFAYAYHYSAPPEDTVLWKQLAAIVFPYSLENGQCFPAGSLLKDLSLVRDGLGSFLKGDYGHWLAYLEPERATLIAQPFLRTLVDNAFSKLAEEREEENAWLTFGLILDGLPLSEDIKPRLSNALLNADLVALAEKDVLTGISALKSAVEQQAAFDQNVFLHLKDQLVRTAKVLADVDGTGGENDEKTKLQVGTLLLQSALNIAMFKKDPEHVAAEFAAVASQVYEAHPSIAKLWGPAIENLCFGLPVPYAVHFWPLILNLRLE